MEGYGKHLLVLLTLAGLAVSFVFSSGGASAATATVQGGDNFFCNESFQGGVCTTTVTAGDTIVWDFSGADIAHTVTECGASCDSPTRTPLFDSGVVQNHGTFQFTFTAAGTYNYLCQVHSFEQRGKIIVNAASAASPTLVTAATPTPRVSGGALPPTGYGPLARHTSQWWAFGALVIVGAGLASFGGLAVARRKQR